MNESEKNEQAAKIKSRIDDLRDEWDRLDAHGSQSERQNALSDSIERLQEQLKNLTGEEY